MPEELWAADTEELGDAADAADFADTAAAVAAGPACTRADTAWCAVAREGLCDDTDDDDAPEVVAVVVSADATPAPANTAPTPKVTAPTPSHP
jgi:hypothetical protein